MSVQDAQDLHPLPHGERQERGLRIERQREPETSVAAVASAAAAVLPR
ncbi:hypothetical protein MTP10_41720 [Nonomuraea sp. 3-1Str]|nr:hypothetical protein [Nonomuraea sp. 3-1Str]MDR8415238.1 hypothetical protein [Nonomuraea sp. 3-1Str]